MLILVGLFCVVLVLFCGGASALLALLRWLAANHARWVPEDRPWLRLWYRLDAGRFLRVSAFWGGMLAMLALSSLMLYVGRGAGIWTALALSILAGWCNPDDLWRYVRGAMLAIASVILALGMRSDLANAFMGLAMAPIIIVFLVPLGATFFMAGAVVRQMTDWE